MDRLQLLKSKIVFFVQNNYLAVIIASILFLIFIPIIIFYNLGPTQKNEESQITPTQSATERTYNYPTTTPEFNGEVNQEQTAKDSGYIENIVAEGEDLDSDTKKEVLPDGSIKQTTSSENPARPSIVITKNDAIRFMRYPVIGKETSDGYKNLLSKQSTVLPGPTFYGANTVIYFYDSKGTALIVDPNTRTTYEEFTFQPPISVEEFTKTYRTYAN